MNTIVIKDNFSLNTVIKTFYSRSKAQINILSNLFYFLTSRNVIKCRRFFCPKFMNNYFPELKERIVNDIRKKLNKRRNFLVIIQIFHLMKILFFLN